MAKHDTDPVLGQLVHAVNESGQTQVPVTVSAHGTAGPGVLIAQDGYFNQLTEGSPLLSALQPASGLLGKEYAKEVSAEADSRLHIRSTGAWQGGTVADQPERGGRLGPGSRRRGNTGRQGAVRAAPRRLNAQAEAPSGNPGTITAQAAAPVRARNSSDRRTWLAAAGAGSGRASFPGRELRLLTGPGGIRERLNVMPVQACVRPQEKGESL